MQERAALTPHVRAFSFLFEGEEGSQHLTYLALHQKAAAIAATLQDLQMAGERALLLYPNGFEYIAAFFGCMYAKVIPVPAYPPRKNRSLNRIKKIVSDSQAKAALTNSKIKLEIEHNPLGEINLSDLLLINTDKIENELGSQWKEPKIFPDEIAFLQYTSGSTGTPKGVMVSHGNLIHNLEIIKTAFQSTEQTVGVGWLPPYHDMGLIGNILEPVYLGIPNILMSPVSFLQKPLRWLEAISKFQATSSGGPNFAYDLCASRITAEEILRLDLSCWQVAYNGAEPIRKETIERFSLKFGPCGFRKEAFYPCYGMAESTLFITGGYVNHCPQTKSINKDALRYNRILESDGDAAAATYVNCGKARLGQQVIIVHPDKLTPIPENAGIGEIWVSGSSVAKGYWNKPELTKSIFQACLSTGEGPFLRTGDLGFMIEGDLFVTGRIKDLIVIRGKNHYPQDIEITAEKSHVALKAGSGAAFSVVAEEGEQLVIAYELERSFAREQNFKNIYDCIRKAVLKEHELNINAIFLLQPGTIPKTSSGKIQRFECKKGMEESTLKTVDEWHFLGDITSSLNGVNSDTASSPNLKPALMIEKWLQEKLSHYTGVPLTEINTNDSFEQFGLNSLSAVEISGELSTWLNRKISPTIVYDYPNIKSLSLYLSEQVEPVVKECSTLKTSSEEDIAIIGMGCRFPGAENIQAFWQLLINGEDAVREVPLQRWDAGSFQHLPPEVRKALRWAGLIDKVDEFDPQFFEISPKEAAFMDPQQRLLLEVSWEALENAGINVEKLSGRSVGVFVGVSNNDYSRIQVDKSDAFNPYTGTGNALSVVANRLSYLLNFKGPSISIDTACSSSLVATHLACQNLRQNECDVALAAGVNLLLSPDLSVVFARAGMLSEDGKCKTLDADANGYVRGEGCGVVVLKRLRDAVREGDIIFSVIKGSAINQDGRSNGLTAPNGPSQRQVISKALRCSGITPAEIGYIELHGTGTALGDPIEVNSVKSVLKDHAGVPCWIGSVKSNIGHLESAAGIAGLIKTSLILHNKVIPPTLHFNILNPQIDLEDSHIKIAGTNSIWESNVRRVAGVSSFGFGGTNAHVILQEAPSKECSISQPGRPLHILALSAKSNAALMQLAERYITHLSSGHSLADICYTAATGRAHFNHRLAFVADCTASAKESLSNFLLTKQGQKIFYGPRKTGVKFKIAYLFTGQGSQYIQMGKGLYDAEPVFREAIDRCEHILKAFLSIPLTAILFPQRENEHLIDNTEYTQPAIFSVEFALHKLWQSWGINPDFLLGHSVGEYVAACVAGVFSLEDGLKMIATRARLMQASAPGIMCSVFATSEQLLPFIQPYVGLVSIAAINGDEYTVISGQQEAIDIIVKDLQSSGIIAKKLNVSHAFHSPLMRGMINDFEKILNEIKFSSPLIPVVSNVTGMLADASIAKPAYWLRHILEPVQFYQGIKTLDEQGCNIYIELGATPTLISLSKSFLSKDDVLTVPSLRSGQQDEQTIFQSTCSLYAKGVSIDWDAFYNPFRHKKTVLPNYPFQRKRYWVNERPKPSKGSFIALTGIAHVPEENAVMEDNVIKPIQNTSLSDTTSSSVLSKLTAILAEILQEDPAKIDVETHFIHMGADSIVLVEALGKIEKTFGLKISIASLFDQLSTLRSLATYIETNRNLPQSAADVFVKKEKAVNERSVSLQQRLPVAPLKNGTAGFNFIRLEEDRSFTSAQQKFICDLITRYNNRTLKSKQFAEKYRPVLSDWINSLGFRLTLKEILYPIVSVKSSGSRFWDADGNEYIDIAMGFGVNFFGNSPAFITEAITQQLQHGYELATQAGLAGEVAELIHEITGVERVTFTNTGTEAVMNAMRIARAKKSKNKIALFKGYYHGTFDGLLAQPAADGDRNSIPLAPGTTAGMVDEVVLLNYSGDESLEYIVKNSGELAAVLIEPVQSRRPGIFPKDFLLKLHKICNNNNVALIFDEIITGFRIHPGGVRAMLGIDADIVTYGKIAGGGMPIGIIAGKAEYMDVIDGGSWRYGDSSYPQVPMTIFGGTFCKHPFALAASKAALTKIKNEGQPLYDAINKRTERMAIELNDFFQSVNISIRLVHFGSLFRFEPFGNYNSLLQPIEMDIFFYMLIERGIYTWERRICFLSTAHSDADIMIIVAAVKEVSREMMKGGWFNNKPAIINEKLSPFNGEYPLSQEQRKLFRLSFLNSEASLAYNEAQVVTMTGDLNIDFLKEAVKEVVNRHEALRTITIEENRQLVTSHMILDVPVIDFSSRHSSDTHELIRSLTTKTFDLSLGPLITCSIILRSAQEHIVVFVGHHIILDGWSLGILWKEIAGLYSAKKRKEALQLPEAFSYHDFIKWQAALETSSGFERAKLYWAKELAKEYEVIRFPSVNRQQEHLSFAGRSLRITIEERLYEELKALSKAEGCTLFVVLLTSYLILLHKLSGKEKLLIGIPVSGQSQSGKACLIGQCVKMIPFYSTVQSSQTVRDCLLSIRQNLLLMFEFQNYYCDQLFEKYNLHAPSINVEIDMNSVRTEITFDGLDVKYNMSPAGFSKYDLSLSITQFKEELIFDFFYRCSLFEHQLIEKWSANFITLLSGLPTGLHSKISELKLVSPSEINQRILQWSR